MAVGTITPNEETGKALAQSGGTDIIAVDTQHLNDLAAKCAARATALRAVIALTDTSEVDAAKAAFEAEWKPHAEFSQCADSGKKGATEKGNAAKIAGRIEKHATHYDELAGALVWIAQNTEEAQKEAAKGVTDIDTSGAGLQQPSAPAAPSSSTGGTYT